MCEGRVDDIFVADEGHAHFRNRAMEGDVGHADGGRGGQGCQCIGSLFLVVRQEADLYDGLGMVVIREQRTQGAVDEAGDEHFIVGGLGLALEETAGELARSVVFFPIVDRQGEEIGFGGYFGSGANGGQNDGVAATQHHRAVGLLGITAGIERNLLTVRHVDGLCKSLWTHDSNDFLLFSLSLLTY